MNIATTVEHERNQCRRGCHLTVDLSAPVEDMPQHGDVHQCTHGKWAVFNRIGDTHGKWRPATPWQRIRIYWNRIMA